GTVLERPSARNRPPSAGHEPPADHGPAPAAQERAGPPRIETLSGGLPVIIQRSPLSHTVLIRAVFAGAVTAPVVELRRNEPAWGLTSLEAEFLSDDLPAAIARFRSMLQQAQAAPLADEEPEALEPATRLEAHFRDLLGLKTTPGSAPIAPMLLLVAGDVRPEQAVTGLEAAFGSLAPAARPVRGARNAPHRLAVESVTARSVAQEQLGYLVAAPGPGEPAALAWQMLLYIFSHGYEGRLGKEAISRRGLVYYIDSAYRSDGVNGWITLSTGVDPGKTAAMKALLRKELRRLLREPPSAAEIDEARRHLLGRRLSAALSNPELADRLARDWAWYGELQDYESLQRRLEAVSREQIVAAAQAFASGSVVAIRNRRNDLGN
ncbi:MAG: insulinase family protein, partial [Xanthomonadales bacterium]|nr:insulinase family protein [Xanthomonadales bacterium]